VSPAWIAAAGLTGLTVGPLQRAVIFGNAVPAGQPRQDTCPACGHGMTEDRLLCSGLVWVTGRCSQCRSRIGLRPLVPELLTAAVLALLAAHASSVPELAALALLAAGAITLAFIDAAVHRLPDPITLPLGAGMTGLLTVTAATGGQWGGLLRAVLAAAALAGFYLALLIAVPAGTGPGDVKFALPLGMMLGWYGWPVLFTGTLCAFLGAGAYALVLLVGRRASRKDTFALGPFMAAGTFIAILAASSAAESHFP
jgi:leader peptidase (prepilin peptidase)/N-methyltransferase